MNVPAGEYSTAQVFDTDGGGLELYKVQRNGELW